MSSGAGINGKSRCFNHWRDLNACVLSAGDDPNKCALYREDYFECLHRRKEKARRHTMHHLEKDLIAREKAKH